MTKEIPGGLNEPPKKQEIYRGPDPMKHTVVRYVERVTLDGIELVPQRVIELFPPAEERTAAIVQAAVEIISNHQKGGEK